MMLGSTDLHLSPILVNRRHRRLTDEELEQAVVMALDQGLIEAADHYQVTPADLHRVANQPRFRPLPRASRNRKLGRGRGRGSAPVPGPGAGRGRP
jgi:hypothetical protein